MFFVVWLKVPELTVDVYLERLVFMSSIPFPAFSSSAVSSFKEGRYLPISPTEPLRVSITFPRAEFKSCPVTFAQFTVAVVILSTSSAELPREAILPANAVISVCEARLTLLNCDIVSSTFV